MHLKRSLCFKWSFTYDIFRHMACEEERGPEAKMLIEHGASISILTRVSNEVWLLEFVFPYSHLVRPYTLFIVISSISYCQYCQVCRNSEKGCIIYPPMSLNNPCAFPCIHLWGAILGHQSPISHCRDESLLIPCLTHLLPVYHY